MKKYFSHHAAKLLSSLALGIMLLGMVAQTASAAILFQDDTFNDIESDAIRIGSNDAGAVNTAVQFGNDSTASENGVMTWNIGTNRFSVDHAVDVTGGLRSDNAVDIGGTNGLTGNSPSTSRNMIRKDSAPNVNAACSALGEVIINTTSSRLEVCTTTGAAGVAVWTTATSTIAQGAANPGTCTEGDLFYNTTANILYVCTATNTFTAAGPEDFEAIYAQDADKTLTTGGGNFSIAAGAGTYTETAAASNINGTGASATAINLNASDAAGGITGSWGTGGLNFSSSTGAFSVSGTGASTVNTTSGNLNLTTTTSGNIAMVSAGNITFDDATLTAPLKVTNTATALNATFPAGSGILDALNSFTSTAAGDGASNVGINNTFTNITGADVQAALASIDSQIGANADNVDTLTFNAQYPNYVIFRDGSSNTGTLVEDYDNSSGNNVQYYGWTTNGITLQDMDVKFRFALPTDFASVGNFTLKYMTGTATAANNKVDVTVSNSTNLTGGAPTVCGTSTANTSTTWATATITAATLNAGCTGATALDAGDIVEVDVKLYDISDITAAGTFARADQAALAYSN